MIAAALRDRISTSPREHADGMTRRNLVPNPPLFRYLRREANLTDSKEPMRFQEREERIRAKAQDLWEKEGRPEGKADEHWYRAAADIDREVEADTKSFNETGRGGGDRSGVRQG